MFVDQASTKTVLSHVRKASDVSMCLSSPLQSSHRLEKPRIKPRTPGNKQGK